MAKNGRYTTGIIAALEKILKQSLFKSLGWGMERRGQQLELVLQEPPYIDKSRTWAQNVSFFLFLTTSQPETTSKSSYPEKHRRKKTSPLISAPKSSFQIKF
ncbi:hypothetical protein CHARACLAT_015775 [Characodon lateralis]|uniref:Uncharacterized protein n=1 Tax=Characodon lateralis TaxID=208331 RepID=A0ABU7EBV1_9TELE|nr:hypothetical protein [Characodon lateralis]